MPHTDTLDSVADAQNAQPTPLSPAPTIAVTALASAALSACGGGGGGGDPAAASADPEQSLYAQAAQFSTNMTPLDAHRFLVQATFGPKPGEPEALKTLGFENWLEGQFNMPRSESLFRLTTVNFEDTTKQGPHNVTEVDKGLDRRHVISAWWEKALTAPDQLRHRVAFALSEILVIAIQPGALSGWPYMCASYYDLLLDNAFGNYKTLVSQVAGHPAMGMYLSHLSNQKPNDAATRIPDQNFAREIMQLFSIGLTKLNMDGSEVLSATNPPKPIDTYKPYDVEVLSHVFTGWGWQHKFEDWFIPTDNVPSQVSQMKAYPEFHSSNGYVPRLDGNGKIVRYAGQALTSAAGEVKFLGSTLNIAQSSSPEADRQAALNILFAHPNVAPFIAKQMIQRLVTSNPSKGYVGRVAKAFKDSGLSLKALVQAILLDTEARYSSLVRNDPTYGKLKEPILRLTQYMRAFGVMSMPTVKGGRGRWEVHPTDRVSGDDPQQYLLGQGPMLSPTVFNFFRPGYVAPNTEMGKLNKVTPEMQLCSETEVAAYVIFMQRATYSGFGTFHPNPLGSPSDPLVPSNPFCREPDTWNVFPVYPEELAALTAVAVSDSDRDARLTNFFNLIDAKLFGGAMTVGLKAHLRKFATEKLDQTTWVSKDWGGTAHHALADMMTVCVISPEFVVQR